MKKSMLVLCGLALWGGATPLFAQARTWGFSADTVFENRSGKDTITYEGQQYSFFYYNKLTILNQGAMPLQLDSMYVERIQATFAETMVEFNLYDSTKNKVVLGNMQLGKSTYSRYWNCPSAGPCSQGSSLFSSIDFDSIKIQVSRTFYDFTIDAMLTTAKRAASTAYGDTIRYRAIFVAKNGRGRDSVIVVGTERYTSAIRVPVKRGVSFGADERLFDMRGRRVESIPDGLKAIRAPAAALK